MTKTQFAALDNFRKEFKGKCAEWSALGPLLIPLQKKAAASDTPPYPIETPVVYNTALDAITQGDDIKIIVVGDNPGKAEQLESNRAYLVGQSGKIAEGFFRRNPALGVDFRRNAIILNKTPVHTAKTKHLQFLAKSDERAADLILQSQLWLAQKTALLAQALGAQIWLVGYAELKAKGIFVPYRDELKRAAKAAPLSQNKNAAAIGANQSRAEIAGAGKNFSQDQNAAQAETVWDRLFVYQHFSMNRFLIDLRDFCAGQKGGLDADGAPKESALAQNLALLGKKRRDEIFGE